MADLRRKQRLMESMTPDLKLRLAEAMAPPITNACWRYDRWAV